MRAATSVAAAGSHRRRRTCATRASWGASSPSSSTSKATLSATPASKPSRVAAYSAGVRNSDRYQRGDEQHAGARPTPASLVPRKRHEDPQRGYTPASAGQVTTKLAEGEARAKKTASTPTQTSAATAT